MVLHLNKILNKFEAMVHVALHVFHEQTYGNGAICAIVKDTLQTLLILVQLYILVPYIDILIYYFNLATMQ